MTRQIHLTQGRYALVDDSDYPWLMRWKWYYASGYAVRMRKVSEGPRKAIKMHAVINKTPPGLFTDHINGNRLDNRKQNLRSVTVKENGYNRKPNKTGSSKFKGVSYAKAYKKWKVMIMKDQKSRYLGMFDDEIQAAMAYNLAAADLFQNHARLNRIAPGDINI